MATIKIQKDVNVGELDNVDCGECKRSTKHKILTDIHLSGSEWGYDENYQWFDKYQIVQCQGCETVTFRKIHTNSEDLEQSEYDPSEVVPSEIESIYPNPEEGRSMIDDNYLLPSNLKRIYSETIESLNNNQAVLTGIGIRAIVETVCKDKSASGSDLYNKINDLVTQGVLTQDGADILHKLRTLGNKSAHEVQPHTAIQLGLALDVVDHLLKGVYVLPVHANAQFN